MTFMMIIQLLVVLIALWVGARYGSLALGAISGIGLAVLVFAFHLKPGTPPTEVIYIIIAAVTCAGVLQASGGMDWMIQIAEKLLRKHPDRITLMAPFVTFFLTVLVGTGHVIYTLMPIICDIALKKDIRPKRFGKKNSSFIITAPNGSNGRAKMCAVIMTERLPNRPKAYLKLWCIPNNRALCSLPSSFPL